ncbi:hypothetical protein SVAN01_00217 [Stagonosporopsis vannaccii]|nr:hypothetical protein SVAN01_00217 [Stagonosporopsis vannaccii]
MRIVLGYTSERSKITFSELTYRTSSYLTPYDPVIADIQSSAHCLFEPVFHLINSYHIVVCKRRHRSDYLFKAARTICFHINQHNRLRQLLGRPRKLNMCTIQYIIYNRCEHWIPQPQGPNGEILRICRQAEEERLGFACPETQRDHDVIDRSQGYCRACEFRHVLS